MSKRFRILAGFALALFAVLSLAACDATTPQVNSPTETPSINRENLSESQQSLLTLIDDYDDAVDDRDFGRVVDLSMPPKLMRAMAKDAGISEEFSDAELIHGLREEIAGAFNQLSSFNYTMVLEPLDIQTTPTGREYIMIPTNVSMTFNGVKMRSDGITLALKEDGKWYLLNPSDAEMVTFFKGVFPDLAELDIPLSSIERAQ